MASTMQTPAANRRCFAMNTPPMRNTPGSMAGIACGSGPKIAHDAERIAKLAPMPTMKQFRMSYCSGLNSSFWHNTAMTAAIAIATGIASHIGSPWSTPIYHMAKADSITSSPWTKLTTRMMPNSKVTPSAISI